MGPRTSTAFSVPAQLWGTNAVAGLSLNLICQQYADTQLAQLVHNGARLRLLFLDPAGSAIRQREEEEGHIAATSARSPPSTCKAC